MKAHLWNDDESYEKRMDITFTRPTYKPKLSGYKSEQEWSMDDLYNDADATVVEDEEGIKLQLKHTHQAGTSFYGDKFNYW